MLLIPIPAFADNCIWGDAQAVMQTLQQTGLQLDPILVTPHHAGHIGGADGLRQGEYKFK
jgi:hydroxyacylglutathione hydrolase